MGKIWQDNASTDPQLAPGGAEWSPGVRRCCGREWPGTVWNRRIRDDPIHSYDGYLIAVEGRIGAQGHLKLVLDTGATHSVLTPDVAKEQLSLRRTVRIVNLDQC